MDAELAEKLVQMGIHGEMTLTEDQVNELYTFMKERTNGAQKEN